MGADLHCHTVFSDGSMSVEGTVKLAKTIGLTALAVTDHDTFAGVGLAEKCGRELGVKIVPGAEITAYDYKRNSNVHVLCYRPKAPEMLSEICGATIAARRNAGEIMAQRLSEVYPISAEDILKCSEKSTTVFKQHIMHALMDAGFSLSVFSSLYYELFKKGGEKYIAQGVKYPNVYDVIDAIRSAKGITVIAHPGFYNNFELVDELVKNDAIDGIEIWHTKNSPSQREWLSSIADERGLLKTGGSDFHGCNNTEILPLGSCVAPDENLELLLNYDIR